MTRNILLVGAALVLAACGSATNETKGAATPAEQAATPDANPAATVPTPANEAAATDFVPAAAASDMFEIQSSRMALTRSRNSDVKAFARMMITAHTTTTRALNTALHISHTDISPPAALPQALADRLEQLRSATDADFDKAYMDAQVDGHQDALNLMQRYAQDGDVPAIKTFAATIAPHVQQHLSRAREIRDALNAAPAAPVTAPAHR